MSANQRNIYEIFDEFKEAEGKQERIEVLRKYNNYALRQVLLGAFTPEIKFTVKKIPVYHSEMVPEGMSYQTMYDALNLVYLFTKNHPKTPPNLTEDRKNVLLIQLLESMEPKEAQVFCDMLKKDLGVPYLTENLVREALPDLLPAKQ